MAAKDKQERVERAARQREEREQAARRFRVKVTAGVLVVVVALVAMTAWGLSRATPQDEKPLVEPSGVTAEHGVLRVADGAADPVPVVVYEDFQCPACKAFEAEVGEWLDQAVERGEVSLEHRTVAKLDRASSTEYSSRAANLAMCVVDADGPKAFADVHRLLFAEQPPEMTAGLPDERLVEIGEEAGVGVDVLEPCVADRRFDRWLDDANDAFDDAGHGGTPTVLVDGEPVVAEVDGQQLVPGLAQLQAAVAAARG
ncbi:thioredoxin domain-containing protein [Aeromicrobium sp. IC_218]|uniref:DsbA family protein n=1 Tax=Aeromicrobium sp. IC_218 TaxID=2545468 RepID=UPI00103B7270|nr:thioredoxin domain-containing protein [Aeromicrobium sp. IC_218]TCI96955.1 disulfide bond formation protein DsbA [Aeromicrobium sp. IC_218]